MIDILLRPVKLIFGFRFLNQKKNEDIVNVEDIYTPLSIAKEEIQRRWNDEELKKKVQEFLNAELPTFLEEKPRSIMLRYIATPNFETKFFISLANEIKLKPLYGEFLEDKFYSTNHDKLHLGKMTFFHGVGGNGHIKNIKKKIIDIAENEGELFCNIKTKWNENLVDFHHRLFNNCFPGVECFDAYCLRKSDSDVLDFYEKIFSICLCYGVLFENFIAKENHYEQKFTNEIVLPAYRKVFDRFGVKPLICPVCAIENEESDDWMWYPGELEKELDEHLNKI